ncbi:MAG TPA: hypothetical protein VMV46_20950 [Thermoanaerobaculia bacterium]|nr:hypothetical protein [Thermoanaerobaculia bacterium]
MILNPGEKVHVLVRRRFDGDVRRQLVGEVVAAGEGAVRLRSYSFSFEPAFNLYSRSAEVREQILSLVEGGHLITLLPAEVELEKLEFRMANNRTVLTDGAFVLEVEESGGRR